MKGLKNYSARFPCPICGRYKSAYKNKCHGFLASENIAFCSREESSESKELWGGAVIIYKHKLTEGQPYSRTAMPALPDTELTKLSNKLSNKLIEKSPSARRDVSIREDPQNTESPSEKENLNKQLTKELYELDLIIQTRQALGWWPYFPQKALPSAQRKELLP